MRDPCGDCGRSKKRKADPSTKSILGSRGEYDGYVDSVMVSDYVQRADKLSEINQRLMARCAEVEKKLAEIEKLQSSGALVASPSTQSNGSTVPMKHSLANGGSSDKRAFKMTENASVGGSSVASARHILLENDPEDDELEEPPLDADEDKILEEGVRYFSEQNFEQARHHFRSALLIARRNIDHLLGARAMGNLANVYSADNNPEKAHKYFRRALRLLRQLRETKMESLIISNGVVCCVQLGKYDEALGLALRKMAISENVDEYREAEGWIEKLNTAINSGDDVKMEVPNSGGGSLMSDAQHHDRSFDESTDFLEDGVDLFSVENVREQLSALYKKHNPQKLLELDEILMQYKGREQLLLARVNEKYN